MSIKSKKNYNARWTLDEQMGRLEGRVVKYIGGGCEGRIIHLNKQMDRIEALILHQDSYQFNQTHT